MFVRTLGAFLATIVVAIPVLAQSPENGHRSGRYVVVFRAGSLPPDAAARVGAAGGRVQQRLDQVGVLTATGDTAFAARLANDGAVMSVGPEKFYAPPKVHVEASEPEAFGTPTSADNLYGYQWNIRR